MINNYHTHTILCDGQGEVEEYVVSAIKNGCTEIGFSGHSYAPWDKTCIGMDNATLEVYKEKIELARQKYRDIKIYRGLELDYYSDVDNKDFDYIIGAVHYVKKGQEYIPVDYKLDDLKDSIYRLYNGEIMGFLQDYYSLIAQVYNKTKCNIIAHIDLINKLNKDNCLFDKNSQEYFSIVKNAIDKLSLAPVCYEVNTGGMARGYLDSFYPQENILDYLGKSGKTFVISSDCHSVSGLLFKLKESKDILDKKGYKIAKNFNEILKV